MKKCPACGRAIDPATHKEWLPFCSERCRLIDLGAWLSESHRIPAAGTEPVPPDQDEDITRH
jgi:endogenous inhibitor of DNA gyrase (YacG/DUF329 family)